MKTIAREQAVKPGVSPVRGCLILAMIFALLGCGKLFSASGKLASTGGELGDWRAGPEGCSRDPVDGLPSDMSTTVLTLLWDDPAIRDANLRDNRPFPDAPLRLEITRAAPTYTLKLDTVKVKGTALDAGDCSTLAIEAHQTAKTIAEGRPTLSGSIRLDCRVKDTPVRTRHIAGDIRFRNCEY